MIRRVLLLLVTGFLSVISLHATSTDTIDVSGNWNYILHGAPSSIAGEGTIYLPNTLDNAHKSEYMPLSDNTTLLRREFRFEGTANYSRTVEIPQSWKGKDIELILERTKPSTLKIDGNTVASNSRITSSQHYNLTKYLKPGTHTIEISVNNTDSIPPLIAHTSNAASESSQTNWNGIIGDMIIVANNPFHIRNIRINDNHSYEEAVVMVEFSKKAPRGYSVSMNFNGETEVKKIPTGSQLQSFTLPLNDSIKWSSQNPRLHSLNFEIIDYKGHIVDDYKLTTGFREFKTAGDVFTINGEPLFLRGTVNGAVFPLTTYSPMDKPYWLDYFSLLKEYGINHVRFSSWTPPEAAFQAADETGMYIMTELPVWGEMDRDLKFQNKFLEEELKGIMEDYSHHPSFVMFSPGNELWGDISLMGEYMKEAKNLNPRILATYGSNVYLGMNGKIGEEDFIVSSKTSEEISHSVRGSVSFADSSTGGILNSSYPSSVFNYSEALENIDVPVISHETGQYQIYPIFSQIKNYNGNLRADNLIEFEKRAGKAGQLRHQRAFAEASGAWASKLYKAEIEAALRTPGMGGVQLAGIQDFPGQGPALTGILDSFLEPKNIVTPENWRQSYFDRVILAEFPKFTFETGETVDIVIELANYTGKSGEETIIWNTGFDSGTLVAVVKEGLNQVGSLTIKIPELSTPQKYTLSLENGDTVRNTYDFWVYPKEMPNVKNVYLTTNLSEALGLLKKGKRVILAPDTATVSSTTIGPLFTPDFWNYSTYEKICREMGLPASPGTLGLLINTVHPALKKFPTENHTDWQWFPIVANSRPLIIDMMPKDFEPIVTVIDNIERSYPLSLIMECNVGKGKLIILSTDIQQAAAYPEVRWLLQSLKEYAGSKQFKPTLTMTPAQLENLLTKPTVSRRVEELRKT